MVRQTSQEAFWRQGGGVRPLPSGGSVVSVGRSAHWRRRTFFPSMCQQGIQGGIRFVLGWYRKAKWWATMILKWAIGRLESDENWSRVCMRPSSYHYHAGKVKAGPSRWNRVVLKYPGLVLSHMKKKRKKRKEGKGRRMKTYYHTAKGSPFSSNNDCIYKCWPWFFHYIWFFVDFLVV